MPVNNYFRNFNSMVQQELINDLTREVIEINGLEVYYVLRENSDQKDTIYNEEPTARFLNARKVEMYINTPEGFEGAGDLVSKFGLDVVDELILIVNRERFIHEVKIGNPREGDLIYLPLGKGLFEIKFVEHEKPFYQLGKNQVYEMTCELYRYNNEAFDIPQQEMGVLFNKIERENAITRQFTVGTQFNDDPNGKFIVCETVTGHISQNTNMGNKIDRGLPTVCCYCQTHRACLSELLFVTNSVSQSLPFSLVAMLIMFTSNAQHFWSTFFCYYFFLLSIFCPCLLSHFFL